MNSANKQREKLNADNQIFKKIGDIKGIFHARMGTINDRNGKDLTEAAEIKKRWQEYTEEVHKKGLNDVDNHSGVIAHLEPGILKCEVKQASGSIIMNKLMEVT